jgi:hypothetical protein
VRKLTEIGMAVPSLKPWNPAKNENDERIREEEKPWGGTRGGWGEENGKWRR